MNDKLLQSVSYAVLNSHPLLDDETGQDAGKLDLLHGVKDYQSKVNYLTKRILKSLNTLASSASSNDDDNPAFDLELLMDDQLDQEDIFDKISQVVSGIHDDVSENLERVRRMALSGQNSSSTTTAQSSLSLSSSSSSFRNYRNNQQQRIPKPQDSFFPKSEQVNNDRTPFVPKLKIKPHAVVPLPPNGQLPKISIPAKNILSQIDGSSSSNVNLTSDSSLMIEVYSNPYEPEIRQALSSPPEWIFQRSQPVMFKPLNQVPFTWIDTEDQFVALLDTLSSERVIAVDLEHHSLRSFLGITCLMQISTRSADFIVDPFPLRSIMYKLNVIFADPNIVKVMHGADYDVEWLQKDFGIYIVSLFDTGQAARVLNYASYSLAFALKMHCNVHANKGYQLADWRIRPIPQEMLKYAREDTHYLLYIFDCMRNKLLEDGAMKKLTLAAEGSQFESDSYLVNVLQRSAEIALKSYEKPIFIHTAYLHVLRKGNITLAEQELRVFQALFEWRDRVARAEDESLTYVISIPMMIRISQQVPRDLISLTNLLNQTSTNESSFPLLRSRMHEVLEIVRAVTSSENNVQTSKAPQSSSLKKINNLVPATSTSAAVKHPPASSFMSINDSHVHVSLLSSSSFDTKEPSFGGNIRVSNNNIATIESIKSLDEVFDVAGWIDIPQIQNKAWESVQKSPRLSSSFTSSPSLFASQFSNSGVVENRLSTSFDQNRNNVGGLWASLPGFPRLDPFSESRPVISTSISSTSDDVVMNENSPISTSILDGVSEAKSLSEVYRISNRNRKKSKVKKVSQSSGRGMNHNANNNNNNNAADAGDDFSEDDDNNHHTLDDPGNENTLEFMKTVGWVDSNISSSQSIVESISNATSTDDSLPTNSLKSKTTTTTASSSNNSLDNNRKRSHQQQPATVEAFDYSSQKPVGLPAVTSASDVAQFRKSISGRTGHRQQQSHHHSNNRNPFAATTTSTANTSKSTFTSTSKKR